MGLTRNRAFVVVDLTNPDSLLLPVHDKERDDLHLLANRFDRTVCVADGHRMDDDATACGSLAVVDVDAAVVVAAAGLGNGEDVGTAFY